MRMRQIIGESAWIIDPIEQWSQLWTGCNWYDFTPLSLEFEWDKIFGAAEASIIVLGLGCRIRWTYSETPDSRRVKDIAERIRAKWGDRSDGEKQNE